MFQDLLVAQNPSKVLAKGEWVWGDAGYPAQPWLVIPYSHEELAGSMERANTIFNRYLSKIRVRCEHTIGLLKGCWQSLKGLPVTVNGYRDLDKAGYWIKACITLHNYALEKEHGLSTRIDRYISKGKDLERTQQASAWHASHDIREAIESAETDDAIAEAVGKRRQHVGRKPTSELVKRREMLVRARRFREGLRSAFHPLFRRHIGARTAREIRQSAVQGRRGQY